MTDTELYEAYASRTKRFYKAHCREDWEDCFHTGFVLFWAAYKQGRIREDPLGYAFGVAKQSVIDYRRTLIRYKKLISPLRGGRIIFDWDYGSNSRHVSDRFPQALLRLKQTASPAEYESFERFYIREQPFDEAYTEMGITASRFRNTKYKAVRTFARIMRTILAAEC